MERNNGDHGVVPEGTDKKDSLQAHKALVDSSPGLSSSLAKGRQQDVDTMKQFINQNPGLLDENRDPMQVIESVTTKEDDTLREGNGAHVSRDHSNPSSPNNTSSGKSTKKPSRFSFIWTLLRALVLDLPMAALFFLFVTTLVVRQIHNIYFVPFLDAAFVSDERLKNEHTYYERMCSVKDVTTDNVSDLVIDINKDSSDHVVENVMVHGGVVIPKILQPSTIETLREFIVKRNSEIDELGEAYPVSQGYKRASFGIDAAEDPIVPVALREVATNPVVKNTVEKLVGPDPAVAEITAITSYYGAYEQAWHSDVKIDGNAVKFARTFTHSYSLFIPLQDTTARMGATEICPGTHYCANEELHDMCDKYGMQISEATEDKRWHAGDGALLSQQVWHRGHAHTDPYALERIVFIVTFISRPQVGQDHRQLSRGTYFHLKWNMWGHTFQDLLDAGTSMKKPFSTLRCLGLWKPWGRNWGFDLLTSSVMRIANSQGGFEYEDLPRFIDNVVGMLHIPEFLQGPVLEEEEAWQVYLQETLDKCYEFITKANVMVLGVYLLLVLLVQLSFKRQDKRFLLRTVFRLALWYGILFLLGHLLLRHVANSDWGTSIRSGLALFPPFAANVKDPPVWTGPTTLPERTDILVGSRFDGKHLWAFNRWLDYHPGNVAFRNNVADLADDYTRYQASPVVREQVLDSIISGNRFLQQAHDSGDWIVMTPGEARKYTSRALIAEQNPVLTAVDMRLGFLLADMRFEIHRNTRLAKESQSFLLDLRNQLYKYAEEQESEKKIDLLNKSLASSSPAFWEPSPFAVKVKRSSNSMTEPKLYQRLTYVEKKDETDFKVGDAVWGNWDGQEEWFKGTISAVHDNDSFDVAYEDGTSEEGKPRVHLVKHLPLQAGDLVKVNYMDQDEWLFATVLHVAPSGDIDVVFDDGEENHGVEPYWYRAGVEMFYV